jgi:hypothetical protein
MSNNDITVYAVGVFYDRCGEEPINLTLTAEDFSVPIEDLSMLKWIAVCAWNNHDVKARIQKEGVVSIDDEEFVVAFSFDKSKAKLAVADMIIGDE